MNWLGGLKENFGIFEEYNNQLVQQIPCIFVYDGYYLRKIHMRTEKNVNNEFIYPFVCLNVIIQGFMCYILDE